MQLSLPFRLAVVMPQEGLSSATEPLKLQSRSETTIVGTGDLMDVMRS